MTASAAGRLGTPVAGLARWRVRLVQALDLDTTWARPVPPGAIRKDAAGAVLLILLGAFMLELSVSLYAEPFVFSRPVRHTLAALVVAPLAWRRRRPVAVMLVVGFQLLALSFADPVLSGSLGIQSAFLVAFYTPAAWARNRQLLLAATFGMLAVILARIAYAFAFTGRPVPARDSFTAHQGAH